jgi:hypothetical protein
MWPRMGKTLLSAISPGLVDRRWPPSRLQYLLNLDEAQKSRLGDQAG